MPTNLRPAIVKLKILTTSIRGFVGRVAQSV